MTTWYGNHKGYGLQSNGLFVFSHFKFHHLVRLQNLLITYVTYEVRRLNRFLLSTSNFSAPFSYYSSFHGHFLNTTKSYVCFLIVPLLIIIYFTMTNTTELQFQIVQKSFLPVFAR